MVDATASHLRPSNDVVAAAPAADASTPISYLFDANLEAYAATGRGAVFAPAQDPEWVAAWLRNLRPDAVIATARVGGQPAFALALELSNSGPFKVARLVGGGHANGNFPPVLPAFDRLDASTAMQALLAELRQARPDIDLLALERLAPVWQGVHNPLMALPHTVSPNIALAVDLAGGFEGMLQRSNGAKKKKRHRYQWRKYQAVGEIRRLEARTPDEARAMLDAFFDMKSGRLQKLGVANVFSDSGVQAFFHELFARATTDKEPKFLLNALEVGGVIRAVTGSSRSGERLICDFAAIADDELTQASPGDYLFYENIAEACRDKFAVFDFGVGDEPYKRHWCDIETEHFDVWAPLTRRGAVLAGALRLKARLKMMIKRSPLAWRILRAIRSRTIKPAESQ